MSGVVVKGVTGQGEVGTVALVSPGVGLVRHLLEVGDVVVAGRAIGELETLGNVVPLLAPAGVTGRVVRRLDGTSARIAVGYGTELLEVDPRTAGAEAASPEALGATRDVAALVFRAPMSGRFYARSAPTKPPMVEVGQILELGQALCLLEVMKTFNRVVYAGEGLPARARVTRIVPADGEDVARGSVVLELESA